MYFYNFHFYFVSISYFIVNLLKNQSTLYFFNLMKKNDEKIARNKNLRDNRIFLHLTRLLLRNQRKHPINVGIFVELVKEKETFIRFNFAFIDQSRWRNLSE